MKLKICLTGMLQCGRGDRREIQRDQEGQCERLGVASLFDHYETDKSDDDSESDNDDGDGDRENEENYDEDNGNSEDDDDDDEDNGDSEDDDDDDDGDVMDALSQSWLGFVLRSWVLQPSLELRTSIDDGEEVVLFSAEQNADEEYVAKVVGDILQQYPCTENTIQVEIDNGEQQSILLSVKTVEYVEDVLRQFRERDLEEDLVADL